MTTLEGEHYYTVRELIERLDVTETLVRSWLRNKHLKSRKIGHTLFIPEKEVNALMKKLMTTES